MREANLTFDIGLQKGLRSSGQNRRNEQALMVCKGAFPFEGALGGMPIPERVSLEGISPAPVWPWPQVFVLKQLTLICCETQIYEVVGGVNVLRLDTLTPGLRWSFADFQRFIVGTNGKQIVSRDGTTLEWTSVNVFSLENCTSVLNYNGQLFFTAYGATIPDNFGALLAPNLDFSQEWNSQYLGM